MKPIKNIWRRLIVEPTDICNLNCSSCGRPKTGHSIMTPERFEKILHKLKDEPIDRVLFFWRGEPCLNPHLPEFVKMVKMRNKDIMTIVSTNTVVPLLHNVEYVTNLFRYLNRFTLSVDGHDEESLNKYREGSKWNILIKNLETICKVSKMKGMNTLRVMDVLMFRWNAGKEDWFRDIAKKYNIGRLNFKRPIVLNKSILTPEEMKYWLPDNPKYWRYKKVGDVFKHKSSPHCSLDPIITVTGELAICAIDMPMNYGSMGNLITDDLKAIEDNFWAIAPKMYNRKLSICKELCCCMTPQSNRHVSRERIR